LNYSALCALFFAIGTGYTGRAAAMTVPVCSTPEGMTLATADSPSTNAVVKLLRARFGEMAFPGEKFNPSDLHEIPSDIHETVASSRRLIFVWLSQSRWVAVTERGGRGYNNPVFAFNVSEHGKRLELVETKVGFPSTVCEIAQSMGDKL